MINLLSLSYFVTVAMEQNMTKAAHKLHISQQALSFHIAKVEDYYGTPLFDRKPVLHLTYAGEVCLRHAQEILQDCERLTNQMAAISGHCVGRLRIGISSHPAQVILPRILPAFLRRWPNVSLEFPQASMSMRINRLLDHKLDMAIGIYNKNDPHIAAEFLFDDRLYLLASEELLRTHFGGREQKLNQWERQGTDLTVFQSLPFMALSTSSHLGNSLNDYFEKNNIKPNVVLTTESLDILESLVPTGAGAMICGRLRASEILKHTPTLRGFPLIVNSKDMIHLFKVLTLRDYVLPEYATDFIDRMKAAFQTLEQPV